MTRDAAMDLADSPYFATAHTRRRSRDHRLIGANDHGMSNIIAATQHLNHDHPFVESDLNWDCEGRISDLPRIELEAPWR